MLVAFLVGVKATGAGITEGKFLAAVLEVVLRQQKQA
jgi:F0F1-type ATP synthase membrane subunit c/vacuolar-type H+-ATPase subunit K